MIDYNLLSQRRIFKFGETFITSLNAATSSARHRLMPVSECRLEKPMARESVDVLSRTRARMLECGMRQKSKDFKRVTILEGVFLRSRYLLLRNLTWCMDSLEKDRKSVV